MNAAAMRPAAGARSNRDAGAAWSFLAPTLLLIAVFMLGPVLFALFASTQKMDGGQLRV